MCESSSMHHDQMPPPPPSPSPEYKHFCRVCNKGFTCGSALGGHMRAHGASGDDVLAVEDDDDDDSLDGEHRGRSDYHGWDAAAGTSAATHAYALRANPNRLVRSCQVCKNCGKEFSSWELFLEHGRCNDSDDDARAVEADAGSPRRSSSPPSDGEEDPAVAAATAWSKGKRSRRVKLMAAAADDVSAAPSSRRGAQGEEEDLANCLVMLSSSNVEHAATVTETSHRQQEPSAPARREVDRGPQLLQPISFLAPAPAESVMALPSAAATTSIQYAAPAPRGLFECKACKKVFTSHQALGGHRASHKKVKGCFAARFDNNNAVSETPIIIRHATTTADPNNNNGKAAAAVEAGTQTPLDAKPSIYARTYGGDTNIGTSDAAALSMALATPDVHDPPPVAAAFNVAAAAAPSKKNGKMHECSVCHRLFTSGQALGGHKRCHWLTTSSAADPTNPVANLTVPPPLTEDLVGAVRHQPMLRSMIDAPEPVLDLTIAAKPSPLRAELGSTSFHLDGSSSALHLQSLVVPSNASHQNKTSTTSGHDGNNDAAASTAAEDEADSTVVKKARLTDLKDVVRMDGEATEPWLQVGIGSSSSAGGGDDKSARD